MSEGTGMLLRSFKGVKDGYEQDEIKSVHKRISMSFNSATKRITFNIYKYIT